MPYVYSCTTYRVGMIASMHAALWCIWKRWSLSGSFAHATANVCVYVSSFGRSAARSLVHFSAFFFLFILFHFWAIEIKLVRIGIIAFGSSSTSVSVHVCYRLVCRRFFFITSASAIFWIAHHLLQYIDHFASKHSIFSVFFGKQQVNILLFRIFYLRDNDHTIQCERKTLSFIIRRLDNFVLK